MRSCHLLRIPDKKGTESCHCIQDKKGTESCHCLFKTKKVQNRVTPPMSRHRNCTSSPEPVKVQMQLMWKLYKRPTPLLSPIRARRFVRNLETRQSRHFGYKLHGFSRQGSWAIPYFVRFVIDRNPRDQRQKICENRCQKCQFHAAPEIVRHLASTAIASLYRASVLYDSASAHRPAFAPMATNTEMPISTKITVETFMASPP